MKIIYKLILGFLSITSLIWVVGFFAVSASQDALKKSIEESAAELSSNLMSKIDSAVYNKILAFQEYSKDLTLQEHLLESNKIFEKAGKIKERLDRTEAAWASAGGGGLAPETRKLTRNRLSEELQKKMDFYKENYGFDVFDNVFVTNKYGAAVAHAKRTAHYRYTAEDWWNSVRKEGFHISDVRYDEYGTPSVNFGVRVDDKDGRFIGVIGVALNIGAIANELKGFKQVLFEGQKAAYKLLTGEGRLIYATDDDFYFLEDVSHLIPGGKSGLNRSNIIKEPGGPDGHEEEVLVIHKHSQGYKGYKGLGWIVLVEYETKALFEPVAKLKREILLISAAVTLLGVLAGLSISRSLSRPLKNLMDATIKFSGGDLDARIKVDSTDEIGELSKTFNRMTEIVKTAVVTRDNEIQERKRAEKMVKDMAYQDHLTGLPNRLLFMDRLEQVVARGQWRKNIAAVFFLDLDRFKVINDTLGHMAGDEVIQITAQRLQNSLRDGDTIARLGGDEFTILIQDLAKPEDISLVIEKIFKSLSQPISIKGTRVFINASIGGSIYPDHGEDSATILKNADIAMYQAKKKGGNSFQIYTHDLSQKVLEHLNLENRLRTALDRNEFILHYQPLVDMGTGEIHSAEALIRWMSPELGLVPPADFIPVAEESGLIAGIGEWVLRSACAQIKKMEDAGFPPINISVNVSARMFQEDFAELLKKVLDETGADPKRLTVEITEGIIMHDPASSAAIMNELKSIGIKFAVDDFGIGYSSLNYLKHLPISQLKIDRSFVQEITTNPEDKLIVSTIIKMAQSLNHDVVAEGVETIEQMNYLRSQHCSKMQGYIFSKPLPVDEFESLLYKNTNVTVKKRAV